MEVAQLGISPWDASAVFPSPNSGGKILSLINLVRPNGGEERRGEEMNSLLQTGGLGRWEMGIPGGKIAWLCCSHHPPCASLLRLFLNSWRPNSKGNLEAKQELHKNNLGGKPQTPNHTNTHTQSPCRRFPCSRGCFTHPFIHHIAGGKPGLPQCSAESQ